MQHNHPEADTHVTMTGFHGVTSQVHFAKALAEAAGGSRSKATEDAAAAAVLSRET